MIESLRTFKSSILLSLIMANLSIALVGSGVIFILEGFFDVGGANGVIIATAAGILLSIALAVVEQRMLTSPINMVVQAILHVSQQEAASEVTDLTKLHSKHGVVKEMVESIFKLATQGHEVTSDLESQRAFLRDTLDAAPVAILMFDPEGKLKYANSGGREIIDYDFKEALGQPLSALLDLHFQSDETVDRWLGICRENKIEENSFWERVGLLRKDNSRNIYDVAGHYSKDNTHGIELMLVLIDRTQEYVADESEMDFVAMAAHELRSPITVIRGYLDVFEDELKEIFNVEQRALLQKMTVSAEMLSASVNNILNVARIEQGHIELHIRQADWLEIIKNSYEDLAIRATVHGRELKLIVPEKVPLVAIDRVSISEVINNLVDNAIKYSFEGGVITLRVVEQNGLISTTVEDKGTGIPEAVMGHLFKKFYRSHRTRQGVTGTGLGLYLSKAIIDSHGGNIWVRSKEGEGSTFGFDLPTYDTIADTLKKGNNDGEGIKRSSHGWIKNHSLNRR